MTSKKLITAAFSFIVGVFLFWLVYRDLDFQAIKEALGELKYSWILLSVILGLASSLMRALRWKMLIESMGYKPRSLNMFISIQILYFINLVIPRGGELARCGVISKYENVPFTKLLGTVFIERLADLIAFVIIFIVVFFLQFPLISKIFTNLDLTTRNLGAKFIILGLAAVLLVLLLWLIRKTGLFSQFRGKIRKAREELSEGFRTIIHIEKKWTFVILTLMIFLMWLLMLYVVFLAYPPTRHLPFSAALFTDTVGTFAFLLPIQAGIGVWHFFVMESLNLFGLAKDYGKIFALIAHTFTNLIFLIFGAIGFIVIPFFNNNQAPDSENTQANL
jgi:glycosyltransferase 2 family protein